MWAWPGRQSKERMSMIKHLRVTRLPRLGTRPVAVTAVLSLVVVMACGSAPPSHSPPLPSATVSGHTFNVATYGARGDDLSDNTAAFADAIKTAEDAGGGVVYVPAGKYLFSASKTGTGGSIVIEGTAPITLEGAGRDTTWLI